MAWDPTLHPRWPAKHILNGQNVGGKFMPKTMAGTALWAQQASAQIAKKQAAKAAPAKASAARKSAVTPRAGTFIGNVPATHGAARPVVTQLPMGETAGQREKRVLGIIAQNRQLDTTRTQMTGGRWKSARARQHRAMVTALMKRHASVPSGSKAIMAGGLIGAGKSSAMSSSAGVNLSDYISINSDVVKEEMAARGMIPTVAGHTDLSPLDRSTLVQQESLHVAEMWLAEAIQQRKNVISDSSMNVPWPAQARLSMFKRAGYRVDGVFIDVPVRVSAARSTSRYGQDHLAWMNGTGQGGRPIPVGLIQGQDSRRSRSTFDSMRGQFAHWQVFDNSGSAPVLVAKG